MDLLQLGAGFYQGLALFVAGVLDEILDETTGQVLSLLLPLGDISIGVAGIQNGGVHAGQGWWQKRPFSWEDSP